MQFIRNKKLYLCSRKMQKSQKIIDQLNSFGKKKEPFIFLSDFEGNTPLLFHPEDSQSILWQTSKKSNFVKKNIQKQLSNWKTQAISFESYKKGFELIQNHIHNGDTYLLNYTQPTKVETNLDLEEIFHLSSAPYKILLKDRFVCFSPEIFVQIIAGVISSYPMKGTIDASIKNAKELILNDSKELAEHNTIVDLIRNDLSLVAENVEVEKFRYLDRIKTSHRDLWQVSSKITGKLPENCRKIIMKTLVTLSTPCYLLDPFQAHQKRKRLR
jgi:para-aminobenzoate synthetase component 1